MITDTFNQNAAMARQQADLDFKRVLSETSNYLNQRGIADSSLERGALSGVGMQRAMQLGNIESERSAGITGAMLDLPFRVAEMRMGGVNSLASLLNISANPMLRNLLETRLGNISSTGKEVSSGATWGEIANPLSTLSNRR